MISEGYSEIPVCFKDRLLGYDVVKDGTYMEGDYRYSVWHESISTIDPEDVGKPFKYGYVFRKPAPKPTADMSPEEVKAELDAIFDASGRAPRVCYVIGIPEGYAQVTEGEVQAGDQLFYRDTKAFKPADSVSIGLPVSSRLWVMRYAPGNPLALKPVPIERGPGLA